MRARFVLCAVTSSLAGAGCGGSSEGTAFVLVDREARQAGIELRIQGRPATASLPVEIADPTERAELVGPSGVTRLDLEGGTLAWVRGPQGAVDRMVVGADIRGDALFVQADEPFVRRFAASLGALPPTATTAEMWTVEGPDVLARSAWMSAPPEVLESEPVPLLGSAPSGVAAAGGLGRILRPAAATGGARLTASPERAAGEDEPGARNAEPSAAPAPATLGPGRAGVVGLYAVPGGGMLLLNAEGEFHYQWGDRCGGSRVQGRYRLDGDRLSLEQVGELLIRPDGKLERAGTTLDVAGER
jgi:hypothetical protein